MTRNQMFLRILSRGILVRRGRSLTALVAVAVAASVATATLNLYTDVQAKLHKEFRRYGANVIMTTRDGQALPAGALQRVDELLGSRGTAVPYSYAVAKLDDGTPLVAAGVDLERVRKLNDWWSVNAWPQVKGDALVGARVQGLLSGPGGAFKLHFNDHELTLRNAGTLRTGASEESRIYVDLSQFSSWTRLPTSTIEIAVSGSANDVSRAVAELAAVFPSAKVEPVRQIVEGEGRVLNKTRLTLLASTLLIILTAALCLLATLTASVLERRKDFAVMKALGATNRAVTLVFAAEAAVLGCLGALTGFAAGLAIAFLIGKLNFSAAVSPRFSIFPVVLGGSLLISLSAALLPLRVLQRVQPATILRGE